MIMVNDFEDDTTAHVLVLIPETEIDHFVYVGLIKREDRSGLVWLRRDRDAEKDHLKEGTVRYSCAIMDSEDSRRRARLKELLDPVADPGYSSTVVPYGPHPDFSNQIVKELAEELGDRSKMCLLVYRCCGSRPRLLPQWWSNGRTCIIPTTDEPTYEEQKRGGKGFPIDDDLAYYIAHAQHPNHDMPGVSVGSLIVANSGIGRFYLARRNTGDAKGTFGTIGGPFDRGMSFMESLRNHAIRRAGLPEEIAATLREGPVLACTNLIGQLDHSVDITFLVTVDRPFRPVQTRYATQAGWYTFEQLAEMYRASNPRAGTERSYPDPYEKQILFAPVRNAFEGYCLLLLSGTIGETMLPLGDSSIAAFGYITALKEERTLRKGWLKEAAIVHEKISDESPFLHEELRRDQA
jgi:hypothetical protein